MIGEMPCFKIQDSKNLIKHRGKLFKVFHVIFKFGLEMCEMSALSKSRIK